MKIVKEMPDFIRDRISYNKETGDFVWINKNKHHPRLFGRKAGALRNNYLVLKFDGVAYKAHRVAWFMVTGEQPGIIDHINGNTLDNRFSNLRNVSSSQNAKNHGKKLNKSGMPCGVRELPCGRYQARVRCDGKTFSLGTFETPHLASQKYLEKRKQLFGEYARG